MNKNIPLKPKPIVRSTTALWEFADEEGNIKQEKIEVLYKGQTIAQLKSFESEMRSRPDDAVIYNSELLLRRLVGLPDILGKEEVTLAFLEDQEIKNINAVWEAIREAENPKKP